MIQSHFDYACSACHPNLNKKFKAKCKISKTNVLDTVSRFLKDLICTLILTLLNFLRKLVICIFMIYRQSRQNQANMRSSIFKLKYPLRNTCSVQKNLSYLTPRIWNSFSTELKLPNSLNDFKHKLEEHFFKKLRNMEQDIFACWHRIVNIFK